MGRTVLLMAMASSLVLSGCRGDVDAAAADEEPVQGAWASSTDSAEVEASIAVDELPDMVRRAALAALPGLAIESAGWMTVATGIIYCGRGAVSGAPSEVQVAPNGRIVSVGRHDEGVHDGDR